jgi:hypothetical protein
MDFEETGTGRSSQSPEESGALVIASQSLGLAQQIELAQRANERKIATSVPLPQQEISTEAALLLKHFAAWCKSRGIKALPCAPTSVAAFIKSESDSGVRPQQIIEVVHLIEALHDNQGLANPVATAVVRCELGKLLKIEAPRSWRKTEWPLFYSLPIEVRAVIERRQRENDNALRRVQQDSALLKQQKGTDNDKEITGTRSEGSRCVA